ncbi:hypothetical protein Tco_0696504 [Tanacetum coccineum]
MNYKEGRDLLAYHQPPEYQQRRSPNLTGWERAGLLDVARTEVALAVLYLTKAEARDQICRAIKYRYDLYRDDLTFFLPKVSLEISILISVLNCICILSMIRMLSSVQQLQELTFQYVGESLQLYANPSTHYYINLGIPDIEQSLADFTFSLLPQTLKVYIEEENMIGVCGLWNIAAFMVVTGSDHQGEKAS